MQTLKAHLDRGKKLPFPDEILINGQGSNGLLFQSNINISQMKFYQPINSQCQNIIPPLIIVYFLYNLSPITITIKEKRHDFLYFITQFCVVLGGTFAVMSFVLITNFVPYMFECFMDKLLFFFQDDAISVVAGK
ncbi:Endoplasmic reticulum-Golgi intermediate compartment protein 1, partial [Mucuna pruriens]